MVTDVTDAAAGDVVVLVGTSKGLFTLTARPERTSWGSAGRKDYPICAVATRS